MSTSGARADLASATRRSSLSHSVSRSVSRSVSTAVVLRAVTGAEPLIRLPLVARGLRVAGRVEGAVGHERELWRRTAAHALSRTTLAERRQRDEWAHRARLAPQQPTHGRDVPKVFWHGGGRPIGPDVPVMLLLNGWSASGLAWPTEWLERLERTFHVIRIDNRGTGYSRTAPAPFSIADLADDSAAVLDYLGVESATVLGLSMGGMIAQELAVRHPSVVERLVLCATRPPSPAQFSPAHSMLTALLAVPPVGPGQRQQVLSMLAPLFGPGFAESNPALLLEMLEQARARPTPRHGILHQMRAIAGWHGSHRIAAITAPTTVVHGDADPLIPVGNGMRLAQLIPGARYMELKGLGHILPAEAPHVLASIVESGGARCP